MKPKYPLCKLLALPAIVAVGAVLAPIAHAQNLAHNLASTLDLGTGAVSYDNVLVGSGGGSTSTIVDATGTTSFTSNGTQFYVGASDANVTHIGTLNLGILNTITADQVSIGGLLSDGNIAAGHAGRVTTLADGTTTINAANMAVGTGKATGTLNSLVGGRFILGADATLNLYGLRAATHAQHWLWGEWMASTPAARPEAWI